MVRVFETDEGLI